MELLELLMPLLEKVNASASLSHALVALQLQGHT